MLTDAQNSVAGRVSGKFAMNSYINHSSCHTKDLKTPTSGLKMKIEDQDFDLETKNETSV